MWTVLWSERRRTNPGLLAGWIGFVLALFLIMLAPAQLLNGQPIWRLPLRAIAQALVTALAFAAASWALASAADRRNGIRLLPALLVTLSWFGLGYAAVRWQRELWFGDSDFLVAAAIGAGLALAPYILPAKAQRFAAAALFCAVAGVWYVGARHVITQAPERRSISTALAPLVINVQHRILDPGSSDRGGALAANGDGFLVVTASGDFSSLSWNKNRLVAKPLALSLHADASISPEVRKELQNLKMLPHRVTDMLLDSTTQPSRVFVAYQFFDPARRCFGVRVVETRLTDGDAPGQWRTVFESTPCVELFPGFGYLEAGGRLAMLGGRLLVTIGDFALAERGRPAPAQRQDSSHGKVWLVNPEGSPELFTMGHRNAQGLFVDSEDRVWETEHGPQGGDELNLLQQGHNYGYPLVTYGTDYGRFYWPLAPTTRNHGKFEEPIMAFTPAIGISNLIRVQGDLFPEWKNDLLIASLNRQTLFRARLRGDRVVYTEPIFVDYRIRDLAEGADGRLALLTDQAEIITIARGPSTADGAMVFSRCRACHDSPAPGDSDLTLKGIVGRNVASVAGFSYSPALRQLGGSWTPERLDAFLADPDAYAPGTAMGPGRVPEAAERRVLIEFLKSHK